MFKVATRNVKLYRAASRVPVLTRLIVLQIPEYHQLPPDERLEQISRLQLPNGSYMLTGPGRFEELDEITVQLVDSHGLKKIHDVAVSAGITSVDLFNTLRSAGREFELAVSDRHANLRVHEGACRRVVTEAGELVEAYCLGLLASRRVSWKAPLSRVLGLILSDMKPNADSLEVSLLSPALESLLTSDIKCSLIQYDLFAGPVQNFDYIRCMNVLNRDYFPLPDLEAAIQRLLEGLTPGGVLQLGRTRADGKHLVTFYLKTKNGPRVLKHVNGGYELDVLVMGSN